MRDLEKAKYLRAIELAKLLRVSVPTVWRWSKAGKFKAYKIGGGVTVFNVAEVEKALFTTENEVA